MQTKIQRWGNSLGLRIPKSFAEQVQVKAGSTVDLSVEDGDLVVRAVARPRYELDALLQAINSRNLHDAIDSGPRAGREAW